MVRALGGALDRVARRWMPDPFVLAIGLTFVVVGAALVWGDTFADPSVSGRLMTTVGAWKAFVFAPPKAGGGTNQALLYFAFQMCLMLVTGHALASSPPVARAVSRVARLPRTPAQQVVAVSFTACAMALVHWGLGLIVGAMIAREVGRQAASRGLPHHYPLLGAAGYTGLMIWGGGLSGSIPLKAIKPLVEGQPGVPLEDTLFSVLNISISGTLLLAIPVLCLLLVPRDPAAFRPYEGSVDAASDDADDGGRIPLVVGLVASVGALGLGLSSGLAPVYAVLNAAIVGGAVGRVTGLLTQAASASDTPAQRIERSPWPALAISALGLGWLEYEVLTGDFALSLNNLNFAFLFLGILSQGSAAGYVAAVADGARGCAGIILQFPLYFGILGIMVATGLGGVVSRGMASLATETTYPVLTYFSAGLVNLFVPSGGGQWIVQGKIVIDGARAFPEVIPRAVLALTYGDALTNMLQPFWAVPLLAITGLRARDIVGYTATVMILGGALTVALLLFL